MFLYTGVSFSQDQTFTQFFNAPLTLNPGFTGSTLEMRAGLNTRIQWPSLDNSFVTQAFALDYNIRGLNSGVGALISVDQAGALRATSASFLYSYKININNKWVVAPGLQYAYVQRNFNINDFTFGSEIVNGIDDQALVNGGTDRRDYFDFSSGAVIFSRQLWFGFSVAHVNRPNVSITGQEDRLRSSWTIHGGANLKLNTSPKKEKNAPNVNPSFIYRKQGAFDQLDMGFQVYLEPLMFGAWYRGLSVFQNESIQPNGTLALLTGITFDRFEFGYSYDFLVSGIGSRSGGAHELALIYQFKVVNRSKQLKKRQRKTFNSVPPFLREKWWDVN